MSYIDQRIREMDYYFDSVQRSVKGIRELMGEDSKGTGVDRKIKRKYEFYNFFIW
jgi:hypothetical protein